MDSFKHWSFLSEEKDLAKAESLNSAMSSKQTLLKLTPLEHKGKETDIIFPFLPLDISHVTDCDVLWVGNYENHTSSRKFY